MSIGAGRILPKMENAANCGRLDAQIEATPWYVTKKVAEREERS
jgi:hypothetical protein